MKKNIVSIAFVAIMMLATLTAPKPKSIHIVGPWYDPGTWANWVLDGAEWLAHKAQDAIGSMMSNGGTGGGDAF